MRLSPASAILLVVFAVLGLVLVVMKVLDLAPGTSTAPRPSTTQTELAAATPETPVAPASVAVEDKAAPAIPAEPAAPTNAAVTDLAHEESARDRVDELMSLAMNNDAGSLKTIWSELYNPDKTIRAGALDAVVQFGDRSVVPDLRALAAQTQDPIEKANIVAAADHLALPPLVDVHHVQPAPQPSAIPQANAAPQPVR